MLENGILVALGLIVVLARVGWRTKLWMVSNALIVDIVIFFFFTLVHWGTFSGVMVASIASLFCSITLSCGKWLLGSVKDNRYYPGVFNVINKLR